MTSELEFILSILKAHPALLGMLLGTHALSTFIGFLVDKGPAFHRAANILRGLASVLDRAPKVAADLKAGDIEKAVKDAQDDVPSGAI